MVSNVKTVDLFLLSPKLNLEYKIYFTSTKVEGIFSIFLLVIKVEFISYG